MEIPTSCVLRTIRYLALALAVRSSALRPGAIAALSALYLGPTLLRNSALHGRLVRSFPTRRREVWLTIDDGPLATTTPCFLDELAGHGVPASFFVVGRRASCQRELVRRIVAEGHTLENHTYSHPLAWWWFAPPSLVLREIEWASHAIRTASGHSPRYFRSPVGMTNPWVPEAVRSMGLTQVGWSIAARDGCHALPSDAAGRIVAQLRPGAILAIHEGATPRHRIALLRKVIEAVRENGYQFVIPMPATP